MTRELEAAIALNPDFADSYMLLAFAQLYAGDPAKGLASAQKAVSLSPRNEGYQFNLGQMYLNNQRVDDALVILRSLQKSGDSELKQRAAQLLAQVQQYQAAVRSSPAMRGFDRSSVSHRCAHPSARPGGSQGWAASVSWKAKRWRILHLRLCN
jgi:tetratricopeptide (TPR) repeat protein